jgi:hypothetical protein
LLLLVIVGVEVVAENCGYEPLASVPEANPRSKKICGDAEQVVGGKFVVHVIWFGKPGWRGP